MPGPPLSLSVVPFATPSPVTSTMSASVPPDRDVFNPGGTSTNDTVLLPSLPVLNVRLASPVELMGTSTVPVRPLPGSPATSGGALNVTLVLFAIYVVSKPGGDDVLAIWRV